MDKYLYNYQALSELVAELPEGVSPTNYISMFRAAVREGAITAVPLGDKFEVGAHKYPDDMVRLNPEFEKWHKRTLQAFELGKVRRGVVVHADDVRSGAVDFDEVAAKYRQQLVGRGRVKRSKQPKKKGRPKLVPISTDDQLASQPTAASSNGTGDQTPAQPVGASGASAAAGNGE
ncbi:hypothetical protein F8S09_15470 [Deinococcus sp. SDU3-2]|uniref:Uncharacterized protein n=1 Tax=Deinococcus terrestris TaxID=2651870 RepID=A0A7X1NYB4_9DEIO|nr:hypothetical protein [Deinococcus terrestris]MPY68055.1 hypothetical protein [Deinococcus terrestris]